MAGTLHGACAALVQAGEWNAATFARLTRSEHVYVPIDTLSRDERSDLAKAKLTGARLVPAATGRTEFTLDRYREVAKVGVAPVASPTYHAAAAHVRLRDDGVHILSCHPAVRR